MIGLTKFKRLLDASLDAQTKAYAAIIEAIAQRDAEIARLIYLMRPRSTASPDCHTFESLRFSTRVMNCMNNESIKSVAELCSKTESELQTVPHLGYNSINEIKSALAEHGLSLSYEEPA